MSDTKNTGGPAFPTRFKMPDGTGGRYTITENGMTLRDHFAGLAMQGLVAGSFALGKGYHEDVVAQSAYTMADEMIKAREQ
jgi:hypothetical protein